jgi:hypothetical protein
MVPDIDNSSASGLVAAEKGETIAVHRDARDVGSAQAMLRRPGRRVG